ncbi:MAG TPA: thermonuclease family protein [Acidimicrobiales bacterium]|nr:thermonuclease family protein [Acidimicrobiales bacterium]
MRWLVLLLLFLTACDASRAATPAAPVVGSTPAGTAVVSEEVDGDTIHVRINGADERVRFIGMDTPETHGKGGLVECFGQEAADHTAQLLPVGTPVRLVRDAELRDRYGRLLAYVYRARDGLFVNLALARDGYADVLTFPPNVAHAPEFVAAVADARDHNRGLWQKCGSADVPIDPK